MSGISQIKLAWSDLRRVGDLGLVGWGGEHLRRAAQRRMRRQRALHAIAQAVRWVLGERRP